LTGDESFMAEAVALGDAARGTTAPNPHVGCLIVRDGAIVGRGATRPGGRPHAEAVALAEAGSRAEGSTIYVSLEPCAHDSARGPACADLLIAARPQRVVVALVDPDPRTNGAGVKRLLAAGIDVAAGTGKAAAVASMEGFLSRVQRGRPFVTLKLALSIDGRIALTSGESKWITGLEARQHVHLQRARSDMILVGRGTYEADRPQLDVRLPGMENRSPRRALLTRGAGVPDWTRLGSPQDIFGLHDVNDLLVEGGSGVATAFLGADLVDRLLVYRAPIIVGEGRSAFGYVGLSDLAAAHGRWALARTERLGPDGLEVYERTR
jgi:diaminohydroxyphosphoribosylaminopyrimidine deaminase/5-amino-6-(5-phosphoribosylamino)uracil reductase